MKIDLHVHSSVSDGTDTPTRLVLKAVEQGLDVIGLCDHDTFDGIPEAIEASKRVGITVLPGIEISTTVGEHSVHLLGYGCDPYYQPLVGELARIRVGRSGRIKTSVDRITALGFPLDVDDIIMAARASPSIGRPHIADAMVAKGYVKDREEAFQKYLGQDKPGYVSRYAPTLEHMIDLVHDAKGVAVIAHPWARGGQQVLSAELLAKLVAEHNLDGIEVDHPDHNRDQRELLFQLGARLGLIRTGSSDYHGLGKKDHVLAQKTTRKSAYREIIGRIRTRGGTV